MALVPAVGPLYNVHGGRKLTFTYEATCVMSDRGGRWHTMVHGMLIFAIMNFVTAESLLHISFNPHIIPILMLQKLRQ